MIITSNGIMTYFYIEDVCIENYESCVANIQSLTHTTSIHGPLTR